jgi:biotin carboxyl carrier protein
MQNGNAITAKVNDQFSFSPEQLAAADIVAEAGGHFHILLNGQALRAELVSADYQSKTFAIKINGSEYRVHLADRYDQMVERLGLGAVKTVAARDIKAPMPGLVIDVLVGPGDAVVKDTPLLILEAMKMENVIKAPGEGVVKAIKVSKGAAVEKNTLLIEMQ